MANRSPRPIEIRLQDPLSETTRKERRTFLAVSMASIAVARTGALPTEISSLGMKFSAADRRVLLVLMLAVVAYFFGAFLVYAVPDILAARWRHHYALIERIRTAAQERAGLATDRETQDAIEALPVPRFLNLGRHIQFVRLLFDFALPIIVGICAIVTLWKAL